MDLGIQLGYSVGMSSFDPLRILALNKPLLAYAQKLHHDEDYNSLLTIAVASFVRMANPDERQTHAITQFLEHLTSLGAPERRTPEPLTIPSLIPPDKINQIAAANQAKASRPTK